MWLLVLSAVALLLVGRLVVRAAGCRHRTLLFRPSELSQHHLEPASLEGCERRLARGLAIATVSQRPAETRRAELLRYHLHLRHCFPTVFGCESVTVETVNELSLLLTVTGTEPELTPYLLLSHMDVVPAVEEHWRWPPFAGIIEDGYVVGRGAIDVKQTTHAILESLERRLLAGDAPRRSLYVALGHDEEMLGFEGAAHIARLLESRGVRAAFALDEGTFIVRGVPGMRQPVALMAVTEKGYVDVKMTARGEAGHSSVPPLPTNTAIGRLTRAVARLLPNPQPVRLRGAPGMDFYDALAPISSPLYRILYANMDVLALPFSWLKRSNVGLLSLVQTSTAVTMIRAGHKENVVPAEATAHVNHRIVPGDTLEDVLDCDRRAISDPSIHLEVLRHRAPPKTSISDERAPVFNLLASTVQQIHGDKVVAIPTTLVGGTDSVFYQGITDVIIRFDPIVLSREEIKMFHGNDERISVENYHSCIQFYYRLMKNLDCQAVIKHLP